MTLTIVREINFSRFCREVISDNLRGVNIKTAAASAWFKRLGKTVAGIVLLRRIVWLKFLCNLTSNTDVGWVTTDGTNWSVITVEHE